MGTALTIVLMVSISIFILRVATVALTLTGLSPQIAKFQALSAFSGAGYTTTEAEQIVNYPVRRRIISLLMTLGNLGLTAILATVVVGFLKADHNAGSLLIQFAWLALGLVVMWFFVLTKVAERFMTFLISKVLLSTTELGNLPFYPLLQLGSQWTVGEHRISFGSIRDGVTIGSVCNRLDGGKIMSLRTNRGETLHNPPDDHLLEAGESLIIFAKESVQQTLFICPIRAAKQARLKSKLKREARKRLNKKLKKRSLE